MDTVTGSEGNDSIVGLPTTLTTGDNINGGDGIDSLSLTVSLTAAASTLGFSTTNVETIAVNIVDGDAATAHVLSIDMLNSAPASVVFAGSSATTLGDGLTLNNVDSATSVTMAGTSNMDLVINYKAAYLAGTGDTATVNLNGVAATAAADSDITLAAGIETLTLNAISTASKVGDVVFGGSALNITGDANLTIQDALAATVIDIDGSASTGKISLSTGDPADRTGKADLIVTGGAGDDTLNVAGATTAARELNVDGGAGDDTITIGADLAGATSTTLGDVLDGGEGTDTLKMTTNLANGLTTTKSAGVSNFEVLNVSDVNNNSITLANIQAGINAVVLTAGASAGTTVFPAGANSLIIGASNAGAYTATDTGTGTDDSLTISTTSLAAVDMGNNNAFTFTGLETVTFDTTTKDATELDVSTITMTADTGGTTTLVVTGADTFHASGAITANVIDFSGVAAAATGTTVNMGAAAVGVTSIKGSAGNDTLVGDAKSTIEGGAGNDTITGGSGNDTLHGDAGKDTITTGAGSDTVKGGDGDDTIVFAGNLTSADKIDGGAGTDVLSVTNASITALQGLTISDANTFNANFSNMETLAITDALDSTGDSFDLGYLSGITTVALTTVNGAQTVAGFDSGNTLALSTTPSAAITATVNSSLASATDELTVALTGTADDDYDSVVIANVETVNINATNSTATTGYQVATVGLTVSQTAASSGGSGAALTVNILGTESVTIDTTIAAETINASGLSARTATSAGFTMSNATGHTKSQTITGSTGVDTIIGSTKADVINTGAGNDSITAGTGADTIDGGEGTDTFIGTTALTAENIEGSGTGTSTGVVVNLGADTITNASVLGTTTQHLSGSATGVASGQVAYLFAGSAPTNSSSIDTLTSIENVTLADGINYVVGSAGANVINGGSGVDTINAGNGADTINAGGGNDVIVLTELAANSAVDTVIIGATAASADTLTGFVSGTDKIQISIATFDAAVTGTPFAGVGAGATAGTEYATFANAAALTGGSVAASTDAEGLIHLQDTGALYLNDDGATGGGLTLIGTIGSSLAATDFVLVA